MRHFNLVPKYLHKVLKKFGDRSVGGRFSAYLCMSSTRTQHCKKFLWVLTQKGFLLRTLKRFLTRTEVTPWYRGEKIRTKKYLSYVLESELVVKTDNGLTNQL